MALRVTVEEVIHALKSGNHQKAAAIFNDMIQHIRNLESTVSRVTNERDHFARLVDRAAQFMPQVRHLLKQADAVIKKNENGSGSNRG